MEQTALSKLFSGTRHPAREWSGRGIRLLAAHSGGVAMAYAIWVAAAESLLVLAGPAAGLACHAVLLLALMTHYTALTLSSDRERLGKVNGMVTPPTVEALRLALPVLALLPLLRILSVAMPVAGAPRMYWYLMAGAPLLLAAIMVARALQIVPDGLRLRRPALQALIALSGVPLAVAAYLIVRPPALVSHAGWPMFVTAGVILVLFSAFVEELIFRGMLQRALIGVTGNIGLPLTAVLFAAVYLPTRSPAYVLLMCLGGLFFGWCAARTGSLWGVTASHGLINVGALLVLPYLWK